MSEIGERAFVVRNEIRIYILTGNCWTKSGLRQYTHLCLIRKYMDVSEHMTNNLKQINIDWQKTTVLIPFFIMYL